MRLMDKRISLLVIITLFIISCLPLSRPLKAFAKSPAALPDAAYISVIGHAQLFGLSCESRSAADLAAYWGIQAATERAIVNALPRSDDPEIGFVGDINGAWGYIPPNSYGVHAQPIAAVLRQYGLDAVARQNMSWPELQEEVVNGRPVVVWVIGAVWGGSPQTYTTVAGKQITVAAFEHTMLISGYSPDSVSLINAGTGELGVYPLRDFLTSWKVLGNMAVTAYGKIDPTKPQTVPPPLPSIQPPQATPESSPVLPVGFMTMTPSNPGQIFTPIPDITPLPTLVISISTGTVSPSGTDAAGLTYFVQGGDTLSALAAAWGLNWQDIAFLNNIQPPYGLFAGQILRIPSGVHLSPAPPASIPSGTGIPVVTVMPTGNIDLINPLITAVPQIIATFIPITPVGNISPLSPAAIPTITATEIPTSGTYTVQPGDYLARLAREWGVNWQDVAQINGIPFPFQLVTGQVLKIPVKK